MSSVYKVIETRRSVRKYQSRNISHKILWRILNAARWAPSAHNAQPWRFIIIKDSSVKRKLAEAMAREWNKDLSRDVISPQIRERLTKSSVKQFTSAPVLVVVSLTIEEMDKYTDEKRRKAEYVMAIQSVSAAIQNLLLAAHAEGLGACWFCAPLFCPKTTREVLEAPESVEPQAVITLGYPAEKPEAPLRKPIESMIFQNLWVHRE